MALRAAGYVVTDSRDNDDTGRASGQRFGVSSGVPIALQATLAWYYEPGTRPLERNYFMQVMVSSVVQGSPSTAPTEADTATVRELANSVCSTWFRPTYEYQADRDPARPSITGKCDLKRER